MTTSVLFFLGGITFTEIAAIRWMARQQTGEFDVSLARAVTDVDFAGRKYLIATTGIISGNSILDSIANRKPSSS